MLNNVQIIGNLGGVPETLKSAGEGSACKARVAVQESWKSDGEWKSKTHWVNVVAFGYAADKLLDYNTGDRILIEGSLNYSEWETDAGEKRNALGVKARRIVDPTAGYEKTEGGSQGAGGDFDQSFEDDDIPF